MAGQHFQEAMLVMGDEWTHEQFLGRRDTPERQAGEAIDRRRPRGSGSPSRLDRREGRLVAGRGGTSTEALSGSLANPTYVPGYFAKGRGVLMQSATTDALDRRARWFQAEEESNSEYFGNLDDQERVEVEPRDALGIVRL